MNISKLWPFHKHKWQEVGRRFVPPIQGLTRVRTTEPEEIKELLLGFTVISYVCDCTETKHETVLGNAQGVGP